MAAVVPLAAQEPEAAARKDRKAFTGADSSAETKQASAQNVRRALDSGVSYAAINYRFRTEAPIQTVLRDCARAIQFLRADAQPFYLDKQRVAAMGGSAGAGTSLWLAFHDDLADPSNPDPVLRESTRIKAAAATATRATYDILQWPALLGEDRGAVNDRGKKIRADWPCSG